MGLPKSSQYSNITSNNNSMDGGLRLRYEGMKFSGTLTDMKKYLEKHTGKQLKQSSNVGTYKMHGKDTLGGSIESLRESLMYSKCEQDALEDKI